MKKPQYTKYSAFSITFLETKSLVQILKKEFLEVAYGHSKSDFIAKLQIALKKCYETEYWLELFVKSEIIERDTAVDLYDQCGTIRRILIASINTAKAGRK